MKRNFWKKIMATMLIASIGMSTFGCSDAKETDEEKSTGNKTEASEKGSETIEQGPKEYSFTEYINEKEKSIWYIVDDDKLLGKGTKVKAILVFENGEFTLYDDLQVDSEHSVFLSEFAERSDEEIYQWLEEKVAAKTEAYNQRLEELKVNAQEAMNKQDETDDFVVLDYSKYREQAQAWLKELNECDEYKVHKNTKYAIVIGTDRTGNAVERESIKYKCDKNINFVPSVKFNIDMGIRTIIAELYDSTNGKKYYTLDYSSMKGKEQDDKIRSIYFDRTISEFEVYDSVFKGYKLYEPDTEFYGYGDGCLITRDDDVLKFKMDSLDTEGVWVDPDNDDWEQIREMNGWN